MGEVIGLAQMDDGDIQQRPVARHLGFGHAVEKMDVDQPQVGGLGLEGRLAGAVAEQDEVDGWSTPGCGAVVVDCGLAIHGAGFRLPGRNDGGGTGCWLTGRNDDRACLPKVSAMTFAVRRCTGNSTGSPRVPAAIAASSRCSVAA